MRARLYWFLIILMVFPATVLAAGEAAPAFETKAKQAYLIDAETGTVLFAKNENAPVPPASLAKLMTTEVVLDAVAKGDITLQTEFTVSEHAWRTGGAPSGTSTMFAALKSKLTVADLIQGVIVQLANDGCIILAEGIAGSEDAFAERMTKRARELGLTTATFGNATGLPDPANMVTMRELVTLAKHIQTTYPEAYRSYAQPEFVWNKITQRNKNPLVSSDTGIDGLAMGFAEGFGYAAVTSMQKDGKRVFLALGGLATDKERIDETRRMLDWAMSSFEKKRLFAAGETVGEASVYGGASSHVPLVTSAPVDILVPVNNPDRLTAKVVYSWPLKVPLRQGQQAGMLRIWSGDRLLREVPVETAATVEKGSLSTRAADALQELLFFWL